VRERLRRHGCAVIRRSKGSHVQVHCGECQTTVPDHSHEDIGPGLLCKIESDCEPCPYG
jgi:predicted RNA binding protein YcfA (HicA-like mRNA interferase family)